MTSRSLLCALIGTASVLASYPSPATAGGQGDSGHRLDAYPLKTDIVPNPYTHHVKEGDVIRLSVQPLAGAIEIGVASSETGALGCAPGVLTAPLLKPVECTIPMKAIGGYMPYFHVLFQFRHAGDPGAMPKVWYKYELIRGEATTPILEAIQEARTQFSDPRPGNAHLFGESRFTDAVTFFYFDLKSSLAR